MANSEVVELALDDLELTLPVIRDWIELVTVTRFAYGPERYPVGSYKSIVDFVAVDEKRDGLTFVGSIFGGSSMEAAILSAAHAVNCIELGKRR